MIKSVISSKIDLFHREVHLILKLTLKQIKDEIGLVTLERRCQAEQVCVPLVCPHLCYFKRLLREHCELGPGPELVFYFQPA